MKKCPVCPRTDIPDDEQLCPSCDVDLIPIRRIHELGATHFNAALRLAKTGKIDAALERAAIAVGLNERCVAARTLLGKILWKKGQIREAVRQWKEAADIVPQDETLRQLLVEAERRTRSRNTKRITMVVIGVLLLAGAVYALIASSLRSQENHFKAQLARLENKLQNSRSVTEDKTNESAEWRRTAETAKANIVRQAQLFKTYRDSHSHTNDEYKKLSGEAAEWRRVAETAKADVAKQVQLLASYQATHRYTDGEYNELADEAAEWRRVAETAKADAAKQVQLLTSYQASHRYTNSEYNELADEAAEWRIIAETAKADTAKQVQLLLAYQASHSHTDDEYEDLASEMAEWEKKVEAAKADAAQKKQVFASYQASHNHTDVEYGIIAEELSNVKSETETIKAKQVRFCELLLEKLVVLQPTDMDQLHSNIKRLCTELNQLQDEKIKYEEKTSSRSQSRLGMINESINRVEADLKSLENEYEKRVLPWEELFKWVQEESTAGRETVLDSSSE